MTNDSEIPIEKSGSFGNYLIHGIDEIILPESVSWWPTAPGWQVLGVLVGVALLFLASRLAARWWRNRYRRQALKQLELVQRQAGNQLQSVVAILPHYLKVTALQAYPRADVASLSGNNWLIFLDAHYAGPSFSEGVGEKLLAVAYLPPEQWQLSEQESNYLIKMSRLWIAKHRAPANV